MTAIEQPGPVGIRRAERADLLDIVRIEREAFPQPWPYSVFEKFLDAPAFLVADGSVPPTDRGGEPSELPGTNSVDGWPSNSLRSGVRSPLSGTVADTERTPDVVGYVVADTLVHASGGIGHVKDIAVRADRRGEGIGSTLLERALASLGERDVSAVRLEVRRSNDAAREMYRDFGFDRAGIQDGYYADGEDALVLTRPL